MKKTALLLFMLFAFAIKAQEIPETFYVGESGDKKDKYYIYPQTVRESERQGYITAWFLFEHSIPQKSPNGKYYTKTKLQSLISCKYNKFGLIDVVTYSKNDDIVYRTKRVDEYLVEEQSVIPSSNGEYMIKAACAFYDIMPDEIQE